MAKLILDIEPGVIKHAKDYAEKTHTDISALVQDFLKGVGRVEKKSVDIPKKIKDIEIADWVKQLAIAGDPIPDFDHKAEYRKHIIKKYS